MRNITKMARKLARTHRAGGAEALKQMSRAEQQLLHSHYLLELNRVALRLAGNPERLRDVRHKGRLEACVREVNECQKPPLFPCLSVKDLKLGAMEVGEPANCNERGRGR